MDLLLEDKGKILSVFDFDDTLAKTDSWIYVKMPNGKEKKLDPAEFAVYRPKKDEEFDFRDFDRQLRNPRIIKKNVDLLKRQLEKAKRTSRGARKVTILTARALGAPVNHFFKTIGLDVYTVALGSADPQHKADWIEKQIKKGYETVYFMDDSVKNVSAVLRLKTKYPDVTIIAQKV